MFWKLYYVYYMYVMGTWTHVDVNDPVLKNYIFPNFRFSINFFICSFIFNFFLDFWLFIILFFFNFFNDFDYTSYPILMYYEIKISESYIKHDSDHEIWWWNILKIFKNIIFSLFLFIFILSQSL